MPFLQTADKYGHSLQVGGASVHASIDPSIEAKMPPWNKVELGVAEQQQLLLRQRALQLSTDAERQLAVAPLAVAADPSWLVLGGMAVGLPVTADVDDRNDGTYEVSYEIPGCVLHAPSTLHQLLLESSCGSTLLAMWLARYGWHDVVVAVQGRPVRGSPFCVWVDGPHPLQTVATGIGIKFVVAGKPEDFFIEAHTVLGELVDVMSPMSRFSLRLERADCNVHSIENLGNGMHKVTYAVNKIGQFPLHVMYNGNPIANSPFIVDVAPGVIFPPHCVASGAGIVGAIYGLPTSFVIHMFDECDNHLAASSADDVTVQFESQGQIQQPTGCEVLVDGSCLVTYTMWSAAPDFLAHVAVKGQPIRDSPFVVAVAHAVAHESKCSGTGLEAAVCGEEATFRVMTCTAQKEVVDVAPQLHLHVSFGESSQIAARIRRVDHGCYEIVYVPFASDGVCQISVRLQENSSEHETGFCLNHVHGSPFSVPVVAGAVHAPNCTGWRHNQPMEDTQYVVSGNTNFAEVHLFDRNNNRITRGGDKVDVAAYDIHDGPHALAAPVLNSGSFESVALVDDLENGTYALSFSVSGSQWCQLAIRVNGEHIRCSPFVLRVLSADWRKSKVSGPGVLQGYVGEEMHGLIELLTDTNEAVGLQSLHEIVVDVLSPLPDTMPPNPGQAQPEQPSAPYGTKKVPHRHRNTQMLILPIVLSFDCPPLCHSAGCDVLCGTFVWGWCSFLMSSAKSMAPTDPIRSSTRQSMQGCILFEFIWTANC